MKGFTIIELIVVIAVISVLGAIVLVNVSGFTQRAQDAALVGNVNALQKSGIVYLSEHTSYAGFFSDSGYTKCRDVITKKYSQYSTEQMSGSGGAYCVCYGIDKGVDKDTICIDSSGYKKEMIYNKMCSWRCQNSGICQD